MATLVADGSKLALQMIVKSKTLWGLVKLGGIAPHVAHFSNRRWQTVKTVKLHIEWVRGQPRYADGRRIVRLLDAYSVHRCEEVRRFGADRDIALELVPAGCTDAPQPCDRYMFGVFKAFCHRLYREEVEGGCSKAHFASLLLRAWEALPKRVVEKATSHFRG
jgi:hypothetical protein